MLYWCRFALLVAFLALLAVKLSAQQPIFNGTRGEVAPLAPTDNANDTANDTANDSANNPPRKREEIAEALRVAQRTLDSAKEASSQADAKPPERLQREVELLKQLEVTVAQQESAEKQETDHQTRLGDLKGQLEAIRDIGPADEKPYSFLLLDQLRDDLLARQMRAETIAAAVTTAEEAVTRASEQLQAKQKDERLAKEAEQTNTNEAKKTELANNVKNAALTVRLADETLTLRKQERTNQKLSQELHVAQVRLLEEKVKWIELAVVFSPDDLQDQLVKIEKQEADLKLAISSAEFNQQYAESEWARARQQLDAGAEKSASLVEEVEAKQLARQLPQTQVLLLNSRLQRLGSDREAWNRRFKVITQTATTEELITWGEEARALTDDLEREKRLQEMRVDELRQDIATRDKKLATISDDAAATRRWIDAQRVTLSQLIQAFDANIASIEATRRLTVKLIGEIEGDVNDWSLQDWFESGKHHFATIWNTELTRVNENPLTIGKVLTGVLLIFCGFVMSRLLSRTLGSRLQRGRIRMNESGAAALQSLSFYLLLVTFTLMSLKFVNVPLTMFTFLGGAIAIGVGFGSQNVINNFISGLILLAERPIKVGDLVQLEDLFGNVDQIGARSTRIRTGNNLDIIVPNSKFLENNVVNLTLRDEKLRTHVTVGIAYGSPTREAERLLKLAAAEHAKILPHPEPFVWFSDFGDNSLVFELHFWLKVRTVTHHRRVESELRYEIDRLFREADITIAFPQRDVHFNAVRPIDIRMVSPEERA